LQVPLLIMQKYTLLFDGQCTICRFLVKTFIEPANNLLLQPKPYQEAQFEAIYPAEQLERCNAEIILVDESNKQFLGGIEALSKTLELTGRLKWLQILLQIKPLKPLAWLIYRLVAWHRYTWFVVPPYLRCSECELKIPKVCNLTFFIIFGLLMGLSSLINLSVWFDQLAGVAAYLFSTIQQPIFALAIYSSLACSLVLGLIYACSFGFYKKALGVNRLEVLKQHLFISSLGSLIATGLILLGQQAIFGLSNHYGFLPAKPMFLETVSVLSTSFAFCQCLIFLRWQAIGLYPIKAIVILFFDWSLRSLCLVATLWFTK
jgi:predicted DCC family thiol-disulfide oxidoreductase YuxK